MNLEARRLDSGLGDTRVQAQLALCKFWPKGDVGENYRDPVTADVPTLILTGTHDPVTPPPPPLWPRGREPPSLLFASQRARLPWCAEFGLRAQHHARFLGSGRVGRSSGQLDRSDAHAALRFDKKIDPRVCLGSTLRLARVVIVRQRTCWCCASAHRLSWRLSARKGAGFLDHSSQATGFCCFPSKSRSSKPSLFALIRSVRRVSRR
ncbi:MAG: hypothetical protein ACI835_005516 [Planctomycetota bacterium]|jgi:hypothetical protein